MFWTIYMIEKGLSLRLGRSSTLRLQDITLSRPVRGQPGNSFLTELATVWIDMATVQGRIYDEIYSPGALMEPQHVRTRRAWAIAAELTAVMQRSNNLHVSVSEALAFFGDLENEQLTGSRMITRVPRATY